MSKHIYAVIVTENGTEPYLLNVASASIERTKELMAFRAEELVDELVTQAAEVGDEAADFEICSSTSSMTVYIKRLGVATTIVASMEIQTTELVD